MRKGQRVCGGRQRGVEKLLSYKDGFFFFFSISLSRELFHGIKENFQRATEPVKADNISSVLSGLAAIFSD